MGREGKSVDMPINTPDIMPTLLGVSGIDIPDTVEGEDFSGVITATEKPRNDAVLITCPSPFGQWPRARGGREYRGIRTRRYTYVRGLDGPWLLFDNQRDPHQLVNLCGRPEHAALQKRLESTLARKLEQTADEFLPGPSYIRKWDYSVDETGTVPYTT
jgi:arylsulfatase A-like enzyme